DMVAYEQILRGGAGLFQSSEIVTLDECESFLEAFNVDKGFSGVQGIGFVKDFDAGELPAVTSFMASQGVNDFKITPNKPARDRYAAILYVHPMGPSKNLPYGFDMYSEPARRATMMHARNSGEISMTPLVQPLPLDPKNQHLGFSMYAPYYNRALPRETQEQRQAALEGYVYASFLADTFFGNAIGRADNNGAGLRVTAHTNGSKHTLYESPAYARLSQGQHTVSSARDVQLYGQTWTIHFISDAKTLVSEEQLNRPLLVLLFGVVAATLVAAIVLLLLRVRARDLSTQKERAVEIAKDELLSLASHQLRTPATGVKQYVGMVLQGFAGEVPDMQRSLLEKAYASNDRQLRIINEVLHMAKIGSGRIVLAKQRTNLNDLVSDVVNEQRQDAEAASHQVEIKLPKEPLTIFADTHMLRMAIENLFSNAIKYTPRGGKITASVYSDKQYAYVSVSDTGIGISQSDIGKIFRQFERLPNVMSQQVGGTGIGLYLAKHLVELHKGTIKVKSKPGKGSTFTIAMPLHGKPAAHMRNLTVPPKT
ncbi:MAG TPA: CHASE domain-containing protein, partial [Candidatus Saccharimonadales bacterium]